MFDNTYIIRNGLIHCRKNPGVFLINHSVIVDLYVWPVLGGMKGSGYDVGLLVEKTTSMGRFPRMSGVNYLITYNP